MKLYTDNKGTWVGTKQEIKTLWGVTNTIEINTDYSVDVPTDKPNLLKFLNEQRVGDVNLEDIGTDREVPLSLSLIKTHPESCSANPNLWDVHDAVLNCDRKHLGAALGAIISRLHDEMEKAL